MSRQLFEEARKVLTQEAAVKLDPVGREDKDIDNDGDSDKTDSYLKKRRGAIRAAIAKGKNESNLSVEDIAKLKAILGEMKDKEEMDDEEEEDEIDDEKEMKKEKVDEMKVKGKGYDNPENMRKAPEGDTKMSSMMPGYDERAARFLARQAKGKLVKGKAQSATQKEDFEMIENLNFRVTDTPSYHEYIKAALTIAECNSLLELSEEDQQYIISEMEDAFKTNDTDFILEANAVADMKSSVKTLRSRGCVVEGFYEDDQIFYVYGDKHTGVIRKVFYEGTQKITQVLENLGQDVSDFTTKFDDYMKRKYGKDAPSLKPRTAQSVIKPVAPHASPEAALAQLNRNIPLPRKI